MYRKLLPILFSALALCASGQSNTNMRAVRVMAEVDATAPDITLRWQAFPGASGYSVFRRAAGSTAWGPAIATLPGGAVEYEDASVAIGLAYEYKIQRTAGTMGFGYVRSGIRIPEVDFRGRIVLVVAPGLDKTLAQGITQLENDLNGDGWIVLRHDLSVTATPQSVHDLIQDEHDAAPDAVKAVYLLGHVPVAYSGAHAPDGHDYHIGAWPCDGYYGEMNGTWTDDAVTSTISSWTWNHNVPADGKFDQDDFPDPLELQVGRVDLSRLDVFGIPEAELLADYLDRAHAWKTAQWTVPATGVVWDALEGTDYPLAVSGYLGTVPCVGIDQVTQLDPLSGAFSQHYLNNDDLFTFQASGGLIYQTQSYVIFPGTINGISDTDLVANTHGGVFNLSVGSYYGDWDNTDNFLRALIAKGNALAHMWSGLPNWYLHHMAMGEPIGYCALRSMNNTNSDYSLQNGGWQGQSMERSHMALMGDPSIRMRYIAPPADLVATNEQWFARFAWSPSPEPVDGYHIYRIDDALGVITRITQVPVQDTVFLSEQQFIQGARYMVRALRLVNTPSGSYHDLSLGAIGTGQGEVIADCEGIPGGGAIPGTPCDDSDPLTTGEQYDPNCDCAAGPIGMEERNAAGGIVLWPIPANDELRVSVPAAGGHYMIRSMDGRLVVVGLLQGAVDRVVTTAIPSGTYVFEYRTSAEVGILRKRFAVRH